MHRLAKKSRLVFITSSQFENIKIDPFLQLLLVFLQIGFCWRRSGHLSFLWTNHRFQRSSMHGQPFIHLKSQKSVIISFDWLMEIFHYFNFIFLCILATVQDSPWNYLIKLLTSELLLESLRFVLFGAILVIFFLNI